MKENNEERSKKTKQRKYKTKKKKNTVESVIKDQNYGGGYYGKVELERDGDYEIKKGKRVMGRKWWARYEKPFAFPQPLLHFCFSLCE